MRTLKSKFRTVAVSYAYGIGVAKIFSKGEWPEN
jgi:hypothetical protein